MSWIIAGLAAGGAIIGGTGVLGNKGGFGDALKGGAIGGSLGAGGAALGGAGAAGGGGGLFGLGGGGAGLLAPTTGAGTSAALGSGISAGGLSGAGVGAAGGGGLNWLGAAKGLAGQLGQQGKQPMGGPQSYSGPGPVVGQKPHPRALAQAIQEMPIARRYGGPKPGHGYAVGGV